MFFLPITLYSFFNEEEGIKKFNIQSRFNHSMILNIHPHSNKKKESYLNPITSKKKEGLVNHSPHIKSIIYMGRKMDKKRVWY